MKKIWRYAKESGSNNDLTIGKVYNIDESGWFIDDACDYRNYCHHEWQDVEDTPPTEVTSDGGSSSYYEVKLPQHVIDNIVKTGVIEVKDFVKYGFDNDFDAGNIVKATKRIIEAKKGAGKSGTDIEYDSNKIKFFAEEIKL